MSPTRSPTLREIAHDRWTAPRPAARRNLLAAILEDPDLAPPPRQERPLTAWT